MAAEEFTVSVEKINTDPDVILYHGLITSEECDHLINLAEPHMSRSPTFSGKDDSRRTSTTTFCSSFSKDIVLRKVMHRCSSLCGYPRHHVEMPQIVKYEPGQQYKSHTDCYPKTSGSYKKSGQRDFTFFLYLNEPDPTDETQKGGETELHGVGVKVKPRKGTAVFWRNVKIDTGEDDTYGRTKHRGLPPENWTKYGMNIWIRHKPWP